MSLLKQHTTDVTDAGFHGSDTVMFLAAYDASDIEGSVLILTLNLLVPTTMGARINP